MAGDAGLRNQLVLSRQQCAELQQTVTDLTLKMEEVCGDMMVSLTRRRNDVTNIANARCRIRRKSHSCSPYTLHRLRPTRCHDVHAELEFTQASTSQANHEETALLSVNTHCCAEMKCTHIWATCFFPARLILSNTGYDVSCHTQVLRRDAVRQRCPTRADSGECPADTKEDMVHKMEQLQDQVSQLTRARPEG